MDWPLLASMSLVGLVVLQDSPSMWPTTPTEHQPAVEEF